MQRDSPNGGKGGGLVSRLSNNTSTAVEKAKGALIHQALKAERVLQEQAKTKTPTLRGKLARLFSSIVLIGITYAALYLSIGTPFYYGGPAWSAMLIWAAAQGAGWVFGMMHLPSLLGMLLVGLVLKNGAPSSVAGLPASWSSVLRTFATATIFLRSGLELNLQVFRRVGWAATRLLLLPGLTEAFVSGALSHPLLGLPILWGFSLGFILKAVGPAIVITTMYEVQKQKLGVAKGIPSIIVAAASFDDMVAITGYSLFSNFAFAKGEGSLAWQIILGPLEIVLGTIGGIVGGLFCSLTVMWRSRYQRTVVAMMTALTLVFVFYKYNLKSSGPLAALVCGMTLRVCQDRGWPRPFSLGSNKDFAHKIEVDLGSIWRWAAQPMLFGIIGTLVNLRNLANPGILPRSLALILIGLTVRLPMSFLAVTGAGLTVLERLFVAIAWTPKATVQAALAPLALDTVKNKPNPDPQEIEYAETLLTTSVMAILVCGTIGVLAIHFCAPRFLAQGNNPSPGTPEWKEWQARRSLEQQGEQRQRHAEEGGSPESSGGESPRHGVPRAVVSVSHMQAGVPQVVHMHGYSDEEEEGRRGLTRSHSSENLESFSSWRQALGGALTSASTTLQQLLHAHQQRHPHAPAGGSAVALQSPLRDGVTGTAGSATAASAASSPLQLRLGVSPSAPALMTQQQQQSGQALWHPKLSKQPGEEEPHTPKALGVPAAKKEDGATPTDSSDSTPRSSQSSRRGTPTLMTRDLPVIPLATMGRRSSGGRLTWAPSLEDHLESPTGAAQEQPDAQQQPQQPQPQPHVRRTVSGVHSIRTSVSAFASPAAQQQAQQQLSPARGPAGGGGSVVLVATGVTRGAGQPVVRVERERSVSPTPAPAPPAATALRTASGTLNSPFQLESAQYKVRGHDEAQ